MTQAAELGWISKDAGAAPAPARAGDPSRASDGMLRTNALRRFKGLTASLGGDADAVLRKCRIDPALLDNERAFISYRAMVQLLEQAALELGRPDFGMRLAAEQALQGPTRMLGPLDVAM